MEIDSILTNHIDSILTIWSLAAMIGAIAALALGREALQERSCSQSE
jgi:hypothetical protein